MRKSVSTATTMATKENEDIVISNEKGLYPSSSYLLDRKIEIVTADLRSQHELSNGLHRILINEKGTNISLSIY
ncbi:MAG: hypothetical protein WBQ25_16655 [Nitrososphaeraceae archaeon]